MAKKFLDQLGVAYLWQKIKLNFVAKDGNKGLSTNDFTDTYKTKLDGIATGATANVGTVTGAKIDNDTSTILPTNGVLSLTGLLRKLLVNGNSLSPDSSGTIDLGTIIREHQSLDGKVDKETGKGLSTNDFDDDMLNAVNDSMQHVAICTCSTAAGTATKTVSVDSSIEGGWSLKKGRIIMVKFNNTNTASNPKLNVNSTGAKSIYYNEATITTANLDRAGSKSKYLMYIYDGTYWVFLSWGLNANTTYTAMTLAILTAGTETTGKLVSASVLNAWLNSRGFITEQVRSDWSETNTSSPKFIDNKPTIPTAETVAAWGFARTTGPGGNVAGTVTGAKMNGLDKTPDSNGIMELGSVVRKILRDGIEIQATNDGQVDLAEHFATRNAFNELQAAFNTLVGSSSAQEAIDTFNEIVAFLDGYSAEDNTLAGLINTLTNSIDDATVGLTNAEIDAAIAAAESN